MPVQASTAAFLVAVLLGSRGFMLLSLAALIGTLCIGH